MRPSIITTLLPSLLLVGACTAQFDWRQLQIARSPLQVMLPCKPEHAARRMDMGGQNVDLAIASCTTAGVTVAVGHAVLTDPMGAGPVLAHWRRATLATMRATQVVQSVFSLPNARALADAMAVQATGSGPDGRPLVLRAAWFAQGRAAYVAMIYGPDLSPEVVDTFFSGLRLQ